MVSDKRKDFKHSSRTCEVILYAPTVSLGQYVLKSKTNGRTKKKNRKRKQTSAWNQTHKSSSLSYFE